MAEFASTPGTDPPVRIVAFTITWGAIFKVLGAAVLVWAVLKLWFGLCLILLSALMAVTLSPLVVWLERRGVSRGKGISFTAILLVGVVGLSSGLVIPPLAEQVDSLARNLPALRKTIAPLAAQHAWIHNIVIQLFEIPASPEVAAWLKKPLTWGPAAMEIIMAASFVVVLAFYLLLDGKRLVAWLLAYAPRRHRRKMAEMAPEVSEVIRAYMLGQLVTSLLFSVYAYLVLTIFGVPGALALSVLAGICDVLPVVGIIIATLPPVLMALTVSPMAAASVLGLYLLYHIFEVYVLVPRVYGNRLALSSLAVLLALAVGATLYGVMGALLVLPLVAAYPVIERYWLGGYLGPDVAKDHTALRDAEEDAHDDVVDAVLKGERHEGERAGAQG